MEALYKRIKVIATTQYSLRWYHFLLIVGICAFVLFLRRPDAFLYPQFWAEDGTEWYRLAYMQGLSSLFLPHTGYFQTVSRIIALFSQLFPISWAPGIFNISALGFKLLPVLLLFSKRFNKLAPSTALKVLVAALYILIPNTREVFLNVTNIHWHLSLLSCMILMTTHDDKSTLETLFDYGILVLTSLSGPFIIFLFPIAVLRYIIYKEKDMLPIVLTMGGIMLVQIASIMLTHTTRPQSGLGASPILGLRIIIGQIIAGTLFGHQGYAALFAKNIWTLPYMIPFFGGVLWYVITLWRSSIWPYRFLWLFTALTLGASLIRPGASYTDPQWPLMIIPGNTSRYWFLPMISLLVMIVYGMMQRQHRLIRYISVILLLTTITFAIRLDFNIKAWEPQPFYSQANVFEAANSGETVDLPIMPKGWTLTITKK